MTSHESRAFTIDVYFGTQSNRMRSAIFWYICDLTNNGQISLKWFCSRLHWNDFESFDFEKMQPTTDTRFFPALINSQLNALTLLVHTVCIGCYHAEGTIWLQFSFFLFGVAFSKLDVFFSSCHMHSRSLIIIFNGHFNLIYLSLFPSIDS